MVERKNDPSDIYRYNIIIFVKLICTECAHYLILITLFHDFGEGLKAPH